MIYEGGVVEGTIRSGKHHIGLVFCVYSQYNCAFSQLLKDFKFVLALPEIVTPQADTV